MHKNDPLTQEQSNALKIAVFIATILVVIRHGVNLHRYYSDGSFFMPVTDANIFIQEFLSRFTDLAIPSFFMISGFLFFLGIENIHDIGRKIKKRIYSLLLPYLLWNILLLLLIMLLLKVPVLTSLLSEKYGFTFEKFYFLQKITIFPIIGQFWYIRTLIIFVCFTPLLLLIYQYRILSFFLFGLAVSFWQPVDCRIFSTEGIVFFYLGGFIGYYQLHKTIKFQWISCFLPLMISMLIIAELYFQLNYKFWYLRIFISVIFLFQISLYLSCKSALCKRVVHWNQYSFFIYAVHGALLAALSVGFSKLLPHTPWFSFIMFFTCILTTIFATVLSAISLRKVLPKFYNLLTGGR
ncbi:MAG: acyltransferase [Lentisphaeria bacterium]|nr:acyltransferase [Lentisphaeria bacterium]